MRQATLREAQKGEAGPGAGAGKTPQPGERLFLALALPDTVRADLAGLAEPMRGFSWVWHAQLHLTLRFLGDVQADDISRIEERIASIRVESFIIPVEGVGMFPPKGPPRAIWAGVGAGHPHLFQLRQRLDDAVLGTGIDFDVRFFQPHITLARCAECAGSAALQWLRRHRDFSSAPFRVRAFDLCTSRLSPQFSEHTLRHRYPLV
jgi:2'-5' RNA ligase